MRMKSPLIYFIIVLLLSLSACHRSSVLQTGIWRGVLKTKSDVEIPFNFTLTDSAGKKVIFIHNAEERFRVDEVTQKGDSVYIRMPFFDSEIRAQLNSTLSGKWIKHLADKEVVMDFEAEPGIKWRFFNTKDKKPSVNITGKWSATFISPNKIDTTIAIGEFKQTGVNLRGTFLTSTGDYRYLEGMVSDNKMYLSAFDGSQAYLFTADIETDSMITNGKFYAGYSSINDWTAKRDEKAILPDAYSLTTLKSGYSTINFSFPDMENRIVSLSDPRFKGKVVIVQFLGSWCPNCIDETAYLAPFYRKYKNKGVEIVALAYERTKDFEKSRKNLLGLKSRLGVDYDILITGFTKNKEEVMRSIPMLENFSAFPTTIIIDKKGEVRKIHTGFSGPGTGMHYIRFQQEFEKLINTLLAEK